MKYILKLNNDKSDALLKNPNKKLIDSKDIVIDKNHKSYEICEEIYNKILHSAILLEFSTFAEYNNEKEIIEYVYNDKLNRIKHIKFLNSQLRSPIIKSNALGTEHLYAWKNITGIENLTCMSIQCTDTKTRVTDFRMHNKTQITKLLSNSRAQQKKLNTIYKEKIKELDTLTGLELQLFNDFIVVL